MNTIKEYYAYLRFTKLKSVEAERINEIFVKQNLLVTLDEDALEFEFKGRDLSDYVVFSFREIAKVLHNAEGEIRCQIDDDDRPDPEFRFYTIQDGTLWEQHGVIVR